MIVVADTSPINYLIQIELDFLLRLLYREIVVPRQVLDELKDVHSPGRVRSWALQPPSWVAVRSPETNLREQLRTLDAGERAAIEVAIDLHASTLLIDEKKARAVATELFGFTVIGTLGIIRDSHRAGFADGRVAYRLLCEKTNFHRNDELDSLLLASLG
jgi:predicted nucleic acid-binding protein